MVVCLGPVGRLLGRHCFNIGEIGVIQHSDEYIGRDIVACQVILQEKRELGLIDLHLFLVDSLQDQGSTLGLEKIGKVSADLAVQIGLCPIRITFLTVSFPEFLERYCP
jgi:hypothetical protein